MGFRMKETIIQEAINLYRIKGLSFTMNDIAKNLHIAKKQFTDTLTLKNLFYKVSWNMVLH